MKKMWQWLESIPQWTQQAIILLIALVLTWFTYGQTLWLPFFFDDLVQLPFVDRYSLLEHWAGSNESPYYRPLVVSIWKLESLVIGRHSSTFQHALNLIFHSLNGCLTATLGMQLVRRLVPSQRANDLLFGLLVLVLYLLFPFHHQAIPWPGALFHILVATLVLATVIAYLNNRLLLALLFAALAPFCHENGVVIPALIFLVELLRFVQDRQSGLNLVRRPLLFLLPAGVWLMLRSLVTTARDSQTLLPGFESIRQSGTYFFQGLSWPAAILGQGLLNFTWFNDLKVVWLVGGLVLLIAFAICYRSQAKLLLLVFACGWWLAASAPAMLVLPFGYIVNSPRLLSLAGCGVALFWAAVIWQLFIWLGSLRQNQFTAGLAALLLAMFGTAQWVGMSQIRESNHFHEMLGDSYQWATVLSSSYTSNDRFPVFINFPSSMAPRDKYFPLGNEGAVFWPGYAPQHTIVTTNDAQISTINQQFVQADGIRVDQPYLYGIVRPTGSLEDYRNRSQAAFYNTVYSENGITVFPAGNWLESNTAILSGTFAPDSEQFRIELRGNSFGQGHSHGEDYYFVGLNWSGAFGRADDVTIFVHAVNAAGELVSQSDGDPLVGLIPLSSLGESESIHDIRTLSADPSIASFRVGLYNRITGERIPFYLADGQRAADDMAVIDILK